MSFSFTLKAPTKRDLKRLVNHEMAGVVVACPEHARDMMTAVHTAHAMIEQIQQDEAPEVGISMNGSLTGLWVDGELVRCAHASIGISTYTIKAE